MAEALVPSFDTDGNPSRKPIRGGEEMRLAQFRQRCVELRKTGMSYDRIGRELGVSREQVFQHVQQELLYLRSKTELDIQSVRDMELMRCDELLHGLWPRIRRGEPPSVMAAIRVMERRARLLGLDAPTQSRFIGAVAQITPEMASTMTAAEITARVQELARLAGAPVASPAIEAEVVSEHQ